MGITYVEQSPRIIFSVEWTGRVSFQMGFKLFSQNIFFSELLALYLLQNPGL